VYVRILLLLILIIVIAVFYRPRGLWSRVMLLWNQRDYILKVIVAVVGIYLLYGFYTMYERGMLSWEWYQ
jgi:hypothetical protein